MQMNMEGGGPFCKMRKARGSCISDPNCSWRRGAKKRGSKRRGKGSCASRSKNLPAFEGPSLPIFGGDAEKSIQGGKKKSKKSKRLYVYKPTSRCAQNTHNTCGGDPNCTWRKGTSKRRGSCAAKPGGVGRIYEGPMLPAMYGGAVLSEMEIAAGATDLQGGKKRKSRKSRSRKGKGPCKSRSRSTCGHKACVFKKSSSRAKAHCSAKGGK